MNPGASSSVASGASGGRGSVAWATAIAILFAAVAVVSFAVEQSVTLSNLPALETVSGTGR